MKIQQEQKCKNWYMRKSGKKWVFGCSVFIFGLILGGPSQEVKAEEMTQATPIVTESTENATESIDQAESSNQDHETVEQVDQVSSSESTNQPQAGVQEVEPQKDTSALSQEVSESAVLPSETPDQVQTANQVAEPVESSVTPSQEKESGASTASALENTNAIPSPQSEDTAKQNTAEALVKANKELTQEGYQTNLEKLSYDSAVWQLREDGLYSNAIGKGDNFLYSESKGGNFIFQTDVLFLTKEGAASMLFRSNNDPDNLKSYTVNLDANSNKVKFWRWAEANLIDEKEISPTSDNKYQLKVVAIDEWISYYVNGVLVANLSDYTLQRENKGQNTYIPEGYFGLLNWNGEMVFQNTFYTPLEDSSLPILNAITVSSKTGTVETAGQFFPKEAVHIQYVKHDAETVDLAFVAQNEGAKFTVQDAKGTVYTDFSNIPLAVGANYLTITSQTMTADGEAVTVTYRLNVHRRQADEVYYNELYRGQYHYSVKDGWANDPNGLVYYNGTYHLFYQFYDDTKWGPMHWAHATSKDLLTWEEQPIAFYPDANGAMFSGCIVVDDKNTSGLFADGTGGLIALITADGEGQRVKLAYSTDEGKTWTKSNQIAADWSEDPLQNRDFRDPKVFRWEDKWFMVIAGGPLRIYSSENLLDWSVETTYADLHMECPDLYPLQTADGTLKWVLSRGGRLYKVGDFKQVDGKWTFVPDADYQDSDGVMNFGKDSYAAMTYYVQDFGNHSNPTLPEIIEVNWMNTWDDYCNLVADTVGQAFNGTFNLNLSLGLVEKDGQYILTQTPINAYQSLRDTEHAIVYRDVEISETNALFKDFSADTYEIIAHFRPDADTTRLGFNLRVGDDEVTKVIYDVTTETLSLDRSQSGIILSNQFAQVNSQKVTLNADGSIDLHLYVDRSSVEVFAKGNTVAGANQIFPSPTSLGLNVFAEGANAKADITLYQLKGIWTDKQTVTRPLEVIQASPKTVNTYTGETIDLKAYIMPASATQELIWTVGDPSMVTTVADGHRLAVTALKRGTVLIRATSKEDPTLYKEFTVNILENNFNTNLEDLKVISGNWYIDGETLYNSNKGTNDAYMTSNKVAFSEYEMDVDIKYSNGIVNLFFASASSNPANAYSIQLGNSNSVRLYRFYGDTIKEVSTDAAINDGTFHHIKLIKTTDAVKVLIDNQEVLTHRFDTVDDYFNSPFVGLGLWDGALEVQNFTLKALSKGEVPDTIDEERELVDPATGVRVILSKGELASIVGLQVRHIETSDLNTPAVLATKDYDLFDISLVDSNNQIINPTKDVLVILPIDEGKEVDKVVYLPNSDQEESLSFTQKEIQDADGKRINVVIFTAKHFSEYGIVYKESSPAKPDDTLNPDTKPSGTRDDSKDNLISGQGQEQVSVQKASGISFVGTRKTPIDHQSDKVGKTLPQTNDGDRSTVGAGLLLLFGGLVSLFASIFKRKH